MSIKFTKPEDPEAYLEQAKRNECLASKISDEIEKSDQWVVIIRFYSALHYLENQVIPKGGTSSHDQRHNYVEDHYSRKAYRSWRFLHNQSEQARYNCKPISSEIKNESLTRLQTFKKELGFE